MNVLGNSLQRGYFAYVAFVALEIACRRHFAREAFHVVFGRGYTELFNGCGERAAARAADGCALEAGVWQRQVEASDQPTREQVLQGIEATLGHPIDGSSSAAAAIHPRNVSPFGNHRREVIKECDVGEDASDEEKEDEDDEDEEGNAASETGRNSAVFHGASVARRVRGSGQWLGAQVG